MMSDQGTAPPSTYDHESECCLVGSLILAGLDQPSLIGEIYEMVKPSDFHHRDHRVIYEAIMRVYMRDGGLDIVTVSQELRDAGEYQDIGGQDRMVEIVDSVPASINAEYYAKVVKELADRRALSDACGRAVNEVMTGGRDARVIADQLGDVISEIHGRRGAHRIHSIGTASSTYFQQMSESGGGTTGAVPTGFRTLDRQLVGFFPSEYTIIGARPSMGKTSLAMNMAHRMACAGHPVGIFSLEMSKEQLAMRMLASETGINLYTLRANICNLEEFQRLQAADRRLQDLPIFIDDQAQLGTLTMRSRAQKMVDQFGVKAIFIDYLQIIAWPKQIHKEYEAVTKNSGELKAMAKELNVPVIVLSQLSRYERMGPKNPPELAHLKSSGAIEQDADVVLMIHTPSQYNQTYRPGQSDILIRKARNGPPTEVTLDWNGSTTTFTDMGDRQLLESEGMF